MELRSKRIRKSESGKRLKIKRENKKGAGGGNK
jgi:hypothetical protein